MLNSRVIVYLFLASPIILFADEPVIHIPMLPTAPVIDGDLSEWKDLAFSDGVWDIDRLRHTSWFEPWRNRLTDHGNEPHPHNDLRARYYTAWDSNYLYFGVEAVDNVNDVVDPSPEDKRWYFKDSICWFMEAPRDEAPEFFGQGDNALCFVIDTDRPQYAAWWRHGAPGKNYIEEPIPTQAVEYEIQMTPQNSSAGDFTLEARVAMNPTLGESDPNWQPPEIGHVYSLEIVHCDPDGGSYGGHFILYGTGDNDNTWRKAILVGPNSTTQREKE